MDAKDRKTGERSLYRLYNPGTAGLLHAVYSQVDKL